MIAQRSGKYAFTVTDVARALNVKNTTVRYMISECKRKLFAMRWGLSQYLIPEWSLRDYLGLGPKDPLPGHLDDIATYQEGALAIFLDPTESLLRYRRAMGMSVSAG